jgi:hypothetical protein
VPNDERSATNPDAQISARVPVVEVPVADQELQSHVDNLTVGVHAHGVADKAGIERGTSWVT